ICPRCASAYVVTVSKRQRGPSVAWTLAIGVVVAVAAGLAFILYVKPDAFSFIFPQMDSDRRIVGQGQRTDTAGTHVIRFSDDGNCQQYTEKTAYDMPHHDGTYRFVQPKRVEATFPKPIGSSDVHTWDFDFPDVDHLRLVDVENGSTTTW